MDACVVVAQSKAPNDPEGARSMGVASIALSITGIVVTVLIVIIIVVLWAVGFVLVASVSVLVVIAYGELALRWCCGVVVKYESTSIQLQLD